MDKLELDNSYTTVYNLNMKAYEFKYRECNDSDTKTATIVASTLPSAINLFEQMYHDCILLDAKERE